MKVRIHREARNFYTEKKYEQIANAIRFFCEHYSLYDHDYTLEITFDESMFSSANTVGLFYGDDFKKKGHVNLRKTVWTDDLICTIFHELTHFHQHLRGDLWRSFDGRVMWKGTPFPSMNSDDFEIYNNLPWEVEARTIADETLKLFKAKHKSFWAKLKFWSK